MIQDYYFTGSGLGVFPMILSTYALLIDVPFLTHAHNLFLEFWLEQGLLGFVAFAWLIIEFYLWVIASRQSPVNSGLSWLAWGGIAATTVMLLHGFVDVGLYSSRALPLMFVPMGVAIAGRQSAEGSWQEAAEGSRQLARGGRRQGAGLVVGIIVLTACCIFLVGFWNSLAALGYANLGSVAQTRVELGQYQWPQRLVENVRKECQSANDKLPMTNDKCGLGKAEEYFRQALAFDAGNVTANQRLGAIALARSEHDAARNYLQAAYRRDPSNPVTERLLSKAR